MSKKENESKYIYVKGEKIYVTDEIYRAYKKEKNHADYLEKMQVKNKVFGFADYNLSIEDIADDNVDIENIIQTKMRIEDLYKAIDKLNDEEKAVIYALFFEDKSVRQLAKSKNTNSMNISRCRDLVLKKLKELLDK